MIKQLVHTVLMFMVALPAYSSVADETEIWLTCRAESNGYEILVKNADMQNVAELKINGQTKEANLGCGQSPYFPDSTFSCGDETYHAEFYYQEDTKDYRAEFFREIDKLFSNITPGFQLPDPIFVLACDIKAGN